MNPQLKTRKKTMRKILLTIFVVFVLGIVYEQLGEYYDSIKYKPVGEIVNVNGHKMHIYSKGSGSPTVVFAAGWRTSSPYVDFYPLYNEISKHTRIAVYDRPGYGWSEVSNKPRNIDTIAEEIHEVLEKSGEKPPYILVGHSIGSLEILRFTQLYKNEVKGVVLIDGSNPEMYKNMKKTSLLATMRFSLFNNSITLINRIGITRLLFNIPNFYSSTIPSAARNKLSLAPEAFKELDEAMFLKTLNNKNHIDEGKNKEANASKVAANGNIGSIPLRIITSEVLNSYKESAENQINLKEWSTDSKQIVVDGSLHHVHWFHPEIINKEILELLDSN